MERWCLGKLDYELFLEESALQEWAKGVLSKDTVSSDLSVSAISCDTASKKRARQEEDEYELYRPKRLGPVSYTHLDVYKRQELLRTK